MGSCWPSCCGAPSQPQEKPPQPQEQPPLIKCGSCGEEVKEYAKGARGLLLCKKCVREEDEARLGLLTEGEKEGLDNVAEILDGMSWNFWKPGVQPAEVLDWLFLGDLKEAMDVTMLKSRGISAVVNLINWWELQSILQQESTLCNFYEEQGIAYHEADSEDRLFFNLTQVVWPGVRTALEQFHADGRKVLVNCRAGHNRSACIVVCWLVVCEHMSLLAALDKVQSRRGTILSNHGFRLQLVRLAIQEGRLEQQALRFSRQPSPHGTGAGQLVDVINEKRLATCYSYSSQVMSSAPDLPVPSEEVGVAEVCQRNLSQELVACLAHWGENFLSDYKYTAEPPTVIGSGFSGEVVLCKSRSGVGFGKGVRCVKRFWKSTMTSDRHDKLKNEALIYLSLEHPYIARLFGVYEDQNEVSLIMQYCSGGTLEEKLQQRGVFQEKDFKEAVFKMLRVVKYIHLHGIVHRDIKPRNWVYESVNGPLKLIDFGFSVRQFLGQNDLQGCMGTVGYLAPEVVKANFQEIHYSSQCDIWSLGALSAELLVGAPVFDREQGTGDGYTQDIILREIMEITGSEVAQRLADIAEAPRGFLLMMLVADPEQRPSASDMLEHDYLGSTRKALAGSKGLPLSVVIQRLRAYGQASRTTRYSMLAMARVATKLLWTDFVALRSTFDIFDSRGLQGSINLESFLAVVLDTEPAVVASRDEAVQIWSALSGEHESLSYCEFLAVIQPPIEDPFMDVDVQPNLLIARKPSTNQAYMHHHWDPTLPISHYNLLTDVRGRSINGMIFDAELPVFDVVRRMSAAHLRWVIVRSASGEYRFFDYMDINHYLVMGHRQSTVGSRLRLLDSATVGSVANISGHSAFLAMPEDTPLGQVLERIVNSSTSSNSTSAGAIVRRIPIVDAAGMIVRVFSSLDLLDLAVKCTGPAAVLKSRAARTFDRRSTILDTTISDDASVFDALKVMDSAHFTICPTTSRELSGMGGGVAPTNVLAVSDLKWVINLRAFEKLDGTVSEFVSWRSSVQSGDDSRSAARSKYNVVSVDAEDSLHKLASQMLASRLQRIFLSSEEIGRLVGTVSSRDILSKVLEPLIHTTRVGATPLR